MNRAIDRAFDSCHFRQFLPTKRGRYAISGIMCLHILQLSRFCSILLGGLLLMTSCGRIPPTSQPPPPAGEWHEFQGTWTASGSRTTMRMGDDRRASIANFEGSLLLAGPARPAVGFRARAIVLNDSVTGLVGRAVWTDEHGDQAYSELRGEGSAASNKIEGAFVGGTGRYSGATGIYEFSWRFLLETEDGSVQGQSVGLTGRIRVGSAAAIDTGGPQK